MTASAACFPLFIYLYHIQITSSIPTAVRGSGFNAPGIIRSFICQRNVVGVPSKFLRAGHAVASFQLQPTLKCHLYHMWGGLGPSSAHPPPTEDAHCPRRQRRTPPRFDPSPQQKKHPRAGTQPTLRYCCPIPSLTQATQT